MGEFGATHNSDLLEAITDGANANLIGWTYWAWKYYDDPTGSSHEALVGPDGQLEPTVAVLAQTYPQAIAGTPTSVTFDAESGAFTLTYIPDPKIDAPTVVFVPVSVHYPHGYCATVTGGTIVSPAGAAELDVMNGAGARSVTVSIAAGPCLAKSVALR
jgi:endoglycosylceramidase